MVPILQDLRFDRVSRLSRIQIDWSLITALIERWRRSETHSIYLPFGECTISLQDVSILLGLRIDGPTVIGFTSVEGGWDDYIQRVLGVKPGKEGLVGGRVKCTWLNKIFPSLLDDASDLQLQRYTQSYLL
ncbi:serine/threonine-protein phosphatase 7 long form-like [Heracleum sosnowskyi]|uniref:Serine/threonine-protein phosphatase 7 long form-like n=1 Tax=Heracleum sosnowskyi TaxID=360622 RepID=A0AAD8M4R9_9APIA|nr:serine/threonine-protein phosphatase 7 long form-like [Heracleum sosnowskyi]